MASVPTIVLAVLAGVAGGLAVIGFVAWTVLGARLGPYLEPDLDELLSGKDTLDDALEKVRISNANFLQGSIQGILS